MLSRIAESLFWIGRYLERAEDTTRIVEVHLQLLLDDPTVDQDDAALNLLAVMGAPEGETADTNEVFRVLCYDPLSACSVAAALGGAREAARRARETVSIEMWEAINTTWNSVKGGRLQRMRPASAFRLVRERCAVISGTADQTMSHDEGWHFLTLGRSLERVDMTARLISNAHVTGGQSAWSNVLRGCGAHHAFVRTYGGVTTDKDAAEFLLLDRLFPRSVVHNLAAAEAALADLDFAGGRRVGFDDEARRLLGTARAALEYRAPGRILEDLPHRMTDLQRICNQVSETVTQRYFSGATAATWSGGI
ncbi:MAG: alpha-E domain-containing protein [Propionicimonas sp.]|uniref:alpha-E domain-containing protein n=1 Tax=Propionicimonas sp. TaxID=1955623 RepID=UPI003D0AB4A6